MTFLTEPDGNVCPCWFTMRHLGEDLCHGGGTRVILPKIVEVPGGLYGGEMAVVIVESIACESFLDDGSRPD